MRYALLFLLFFLAVPEVVSAQVTGPSFYVHRNGVNQTITNGSFTTVDWTTENFDTGNDFDLTTERFTPSVAGKYLFILNAYPSGDLVYARIRKNGTDLFTQSGGSGGAGVEIISGSVILDLNGTTDWVDAQVFSNSTVLNGNEGQTYFTGSFLSPVVSQFDPSETLTIAFATSTRLYGYGLDVGTAVMLGGLLMFFLGYWFVGLIRKRNTWNI